MQISHIKINNILGISELEITPGKFNEITGKNGVGKTSILECIKSATQGGHDATLLRKGETEGEIVLLLDDGTEITKKVTAEGSDLKIRQDGKSAKKPVSVLNEIRDLVSVNPVEFLTASKKDRLEIILQALKFDVTEEQISEAAGFAVKIRGSQLETIGEVRKQIYEERRGLNAQLKEKRGTINQLTESIPQNTGITDLAGAQALSEKIIALHAANEQKKVEIRADMQRETNAIDEQIRALQHQRNTVEASFNTFLTQADNDYKAEIAPLQQELANADEAMKNGAKIEQLKQTIEQMEQGYLELEKQSASKTQAMERLDALKESMIANMPFKGLTIQEGELYIDGIQFDRINTSNQVKFCINLARQRSGALNMVCLDGLELIDSERYTAFKQIASTMDTQFFVTRVSASELELNGTPITVV